MPSQAHRCGGLVTGLVGSIVALLLLATASSAADVVVTGKVLYGSGRDARLVAVADIVQVYNQNPAYMRIKALGLSEGDGHGRELFEQAQKWSNKALATVARDKGLDVITVPGGVEGSESPPEDVTQAVIDELPAHCIDGNVLHGSAQGGRSVAEVDSQAVLEAIPEYVEWRGLDENDARWHILRKAYLDSFAKALKRAVRDEGLDVVVERGGVTSRLGPVSDVTALVIQALVA